MKRFHCCLSRIKIVSLRGLPIVKSQSFGLSREVLETLWLLVVSLREHPVVKSRSFGLSHGLWGHYCRKQYPLYLTNCHCGRYHNHSTLSYLLEPVNRHCAQLTYMWQLWSPWGKMGWIPKTIQIKSRTDGIKPFLLQDQNVSPTSQTCLWICVKFSINIL